MTDHGGLIGYKMTPTAARRWTEVNMRLIDKDIAVRGLRMAHDDDGADFVEAINEVDAVEEKQGFWKAAGTNSPKSRNQKWRKIDQ